MYNKVLYLINIHIIFQYINKGVYKIVFQYELTNKDFKNYNK